MASSSSSSSSSSSASAIAVLAILVTLALQATASINDILSPLLSPIFDDVCKEVECGKGTCKPSTNSTFYFECECDSGWKQTASEIDHHHHLKFLPCIVPNCTLDYSCSKAPSPAPAKSRSNESIFDPCHWSECGGGSCNRTSKFAYSCVCAEGYSNLLNVTSFPCFKECALGMDCSSLGIGGSNKSASSPPPVLAISGEKQARSTLEVNFHWLTTLLLSLAMLLWN